LAPHVVDVGGGLLAVEHPSADLDRLSHGVSRRLAGLLALADQVRGALIVDGERLDDDPVVERANRAVCGGFGEGELWAFGCFHGVWVVANVGNLTSPPLGATIFEGRPRAGREPDVMRRERC